MKGLVRRVGSGERGFTLIELLVVIAILGIIAAVVVLNIGSFLGSGAKEAANTELHQVQTAVIAYMAYYPAAGVPEGAVDFTDPDGPAKYLLNPGTVKGEYTVGPDGKVTGTNYPGLTWDEAGGQWTTSS